MKDSLYVPQVLVDTTWHLLWYLYLLLLLILLMMDRLILLWCIKGVFIRRGQTNPVPDSPPSPQAGLGEVQKCVTGTLAPVGRRNKRTVPMFYHAYYQTLCEGMCEHVEVSHHDVATPHPYKPDCVCVDSE